MACPYFFPTERHDAELWPHRHRLPLTDGWRGRCTVTEEDCTDDELRDFCNLGNARNCPHLPSDRTADAVRFGLRQANGTIEILYVCERNYAPGEVGMLKLETVTGEWAGRHPNHCIQRMAECVANATRNLLPRMNTKIAHKDH